MITNHYKEHYFHKIKYQLWRQNYHRVVDYGNSIHCPTNSLSHNVVNMFVCGVIKGFPQKLSVSQYSSRSKRQYGNTPHRRTSTTTDILLQYLFICVQCLKQTTNVLSSSILNEVYLVSIILNIKYIYMINTLCTVETYYFNTINVRNTCRNFIHRYHTQCMLSRSLSI